MWLLIGGGAFLFFVIAVFSLVYLVFGGSQDDSLAFGDKIAVVDLEASSSLPSRSFPS